jgi:hypothetical protein
MLANANGTGRKMSGLLLLAGSVIGLVGNALHPHSADPDPAATILALAQDGTWIWIHLAIIVAILLIIGGLAGLAAELSGSAAGPLAEVGFAAAVLGGAVVTISNAIDGFGLKALAVSAAASATGRAEVLRVGVAVDEVDFAIWSIGMLVFFGIAFACLGVALTASRRFPAWYGWIATVGALGSGVAAVIQIAAGAEVQVAETLFLASSLLLTGWVFIVGLRMWQGLAAPAAGESRLAPAVADRRP